MKKLLDSLIAMVMDLRFALPRGWRRGMEIRHERYLVPGSFDIGTAEMGVKERIAALPAIPLDDRLERIMAFAANVRDVERVGKDFLVDGIMAIIDRDLHLELLDFTPPTDADIAWAKEVSEKLGLGPLPVLETKKEES